MNELYLDCSNNSNFSLVTNNEIFTVNESEKKNFTNLVGIDINDILNLLDTHSLTLEDITKIYIIPLIVNHKPKVLFYDKDNIVEGIYNKDFKSLHMLSSIGDSRIIKEVNNSYIKVNNIKVNYKLVSKEYVYKEYFKEDNLAYVNYTAFTPKVTINGKTDNKYKKLEEYLDNSVTSFRTFNQTINVYKDIDISKYNKVILENSYNNLYNTSVLTSTMLSKIKTNAVYNTLRVDFKVPNTFKKSKKEYNKIIKEEIVAVIKNERKVTLFNENNNIIITNKNNKEKILKRANYYKDEQPVEIDNNVILNLCMAGDTPSWDINGIITNLNMLRINYLLYNNVLYERKRTFPEIIKKAEPIFEFNNYDNMEYKEHDYYGLKLYEFFNIYKNIDDIIDYIETKDSKMYTTGNTKSAYPTDRINLSSLLPINVVQNNTFHKKLIKDKYNFRDIKRIDNTLNYSDGVIYNNKYRLIPHTDGNGTFTSLVYMNKDPLFKTSTDMYSLYIEEIDTHVPYLNDIVPYVREVFTEKGLMLSKEELLLLQKNYMKKMYSINQDFAVVTTSKDFSDRDFKLELSTTGEYNSMFIFYSPLLHSPNYDDFHKYKKENFKRKVIANFII